jgi:septum formation protein
MTEVILASGSAARQRMLQAAGLSFHIAVCPVDEAGLRAELEGDGVVAEQAALALAEAKARTVSLQHPQALVIGADQLLEHDDRWLEKPAGRPEARAQLQALRGRSHRLISGVVLCRAGLAIWQAVDSADLTMRGFSDRFLDQYLDTAGDAVTTSVGAYQLEGLGAQLFTAVRGDFFTILGLPLLPLLQALRDHGALSS